MILGELSEIFEIHEMLVVNKNFVLRTWRIKFLLTTKTINMKKVFLFVIAFGAVIAFATTNTGTGGGKKNNKNNATTVADTSLFKIRVSKDSTTNSKPKKGEILVAADTAHYRKSDSAAFARAKDAGLISASEEKQWPR